MPSIVAGKLVTRAVASLGAVETDPAVAIGDLMDPQVTVGVASGGTFTATWFVEISFDNGVSFVQFDTGTAAKLVTLPRCTHVRGRCSAFTAGPILMYVSGTNPNAPA